MSVNGFKQNTKGKQVKFTLVQTNVTEYIQVTK